MFCVLCFIFYVLCSSFYVLYLCFMLYVLCFMFYNYGYANINSVKQEVGNTYGGVSGGYSYVDANGKLQQVQYIADGAGFRVADSRLPVAPVYDGVAPTFSPEPLVAPV